MGNREFKSQKKSNLWCTSFSAQWCLLHGFYISNKHFGFYDEQRHPLNNHHTRCGVWWMYRRITPNRIAEVFSRWISDFTNGPVLIIEHLLWVRSNVLTWSSVTSVILRESNRHINLLNWSKTSVQNCCCCSSESSIMRLSVSPLRSLQVSFSAVQTHVEKETWPHQYPYSFVVMDN